jgi:predicted nucleotidyltransferase component of viral defense system
MAALNYTNIYALQDKGLAVIFSTETTFYLTGGTCLNRFYHNRRYSDDLDLFTNENALFRDDVRILLDTLKSASLPYAIQVDTRDFVRLFIEERLQLDLVNDRVYRYGKSIRSPLGIVLDNELNICANKLCAIIGRDDPKDMFDLYTIFKKGKIDWKTVITAAAKKCVLDPEVLEYRLSSFPLELLDLLAVVDPTTVSEMKQGYPRMVEHILLIMP